MGTHDEQCDTSSDVTESLVKKSQKSSFWRRCTQPFRETWRDLKSMTWRRDGLIHLHMIWVLGLVAGIIWVTVQPGGYNSIMSGSWVSSTVTACQPDGGFSVIADSFNWWAPKGLFQITLKTGNISFESAKAIDICWNLIAGRGGQALLAMTAARVWIECLAVSIATKPASYTTVWLLRFYTEPSTISILRMARQFILGRGLASTFKMWFIVIAGLFVVAFPTLMSSLAGYTGSIQGWVDLGDNGLTSFSQAFPLAFVVHDGDRIDLTKDYHVPFREEVGGGQLVSSYSYIPTKSSVITYQSYPADNNYQRKYSVVDNITSYVFSYGISSLPESAIAKGKNDTIFAGKTLKGKALNISAFYLPSGLFYPDFDTSPWSSIPADDPLFRDKSMMTYSVSNQMLKIVELQANGTCQPMQNKYQWGFSYLQLFVNVMLLTLWTIGMALIWAQSYLTLKLNGFSALHNNWKGLLEFAEVLGGQLKAAGIDYLTIDDQQLEHEIEKILQGGSVSGVPLTQGYYSMWQGIVRRKWLISALFWGLLAIMTDSITHWSLYDGVGYMSMAVKCIAAISVAVWVCTQMCGSIFLKVPIFIFVCGVFVPPYLYLFPGWMFFPGSYVGATFALISGTTLGSRAVLFTVPFAINYIVVFAVFM